MAITKVSRGLLSTGISDSSDATAITITSAEKVGIGETSPLGTLHVKTADSSGSADSGADELVLENSGDTGMTILSGTSNSGSIRFGDSDDNDNGIIIYNHGSSPYMRFFVDASERMRIDSSGSVLIGSTTSIASNIGLQVTSTDAAGFISLFRDDSSIVADDDLGGILFYGDDNNATTQFAYIRATSEGTHADGDNPTALRFGTTTDGSESVSEKMRITSSGNLEIADGDLVVASGHGISFSATANSSGTMQNEQFDDYEEGTWTPTISGVASNNVDALTAAEGFYTKIGRMVYVSFHANCDPTLTSVPIILGGLPYTVSDLIQNSGIEGTSAIFSDNSLFLAFPLSGGTTFVIELDRPMQGTAASGAAAYRGSFFYPAAT